MNAAARLYRDRAITAMLRAGKSVQQTARAFCLPRSEIENAYSRTLDFEEKKQ